MFSKIFTPRQNEIMTCLRIVDTMYLLYLYSLPWKYKSNIIYMYTTIFRTGVKWKSDNKIWSNTTFLVNSSHIEKEEIVNY